MSAIYKNVAHKEKLYDFTAFRKNDYEPDPETGFQILREFCDSLDNKMGKKVYTSFSMIPGSGHILSGKEIPLSAMEEIQSFSKENLPAVSITARAHRSKTNQMIRNFAELGAMLPALPLLWVADKISEQPKIKLEIK